MLTINLAHSESSDIKYKVTSFPDGQQDVTLDKTTLDQMSVTQEVTILSRFNSFRDYELIAATTAAARRMGFKTVHLKLPYLLGARSDRKFVDGGTSYLVDVVAPAINLLNFESVTVLDVHSDVAAACIKNLVPVDNCTLVKHALENLEVKEGNYALVSPDAGALKKVYKVAEFVNYTGEVIVCSKHRGTDGRLSNTVVPVTDEDLRKDLIIVDDICDGGRTFINISEAINVKRAEFLAANPDVKIAGFGRVILIVTHGIFSAGFETLVKYFNNIVTTDSVKTFEQITEMQKGIGNDQFVHVFELFTK